MTGEGPCRDRREARLVLRPLLTAVHAVSLSIRDFVLIEKLDLDFRARRWRLGGLGALTGETGAGKSILIDALGLALGARADSARRAARRGAGVGRRLVRSAAGAIPPTPSWPSRALDDEDVLTCVARSAPTAAAAPSSTTSRPRWRCCAGWATRWSRSRARWSSTAFSTWRPTAPRSMPSPGWRSRPPPCATAWQAWRAAEQARADAEAAAAAARRDEDFLRHAVKELEALAPKADDEETLAAERQLLRAGSALWARRWPQALGELEAGTRRRRRPARGASADRAQRRQGGRPARRVAGGARPGARARRPRRRPSSRRRAMRWSSIPTGWRRSRSGCSRCAPPPASTASPWPSSRRWPRRWPPSSPRSTTARPA